MYHELPLERRRGEAAGTATRPLTETLFSPGSGQSTSGSSASISSRSRRSLGAINFIVHDPQDARARHELDAHAALRLDDVVYSFLLVFALPVIERRR